MGPIIIDVDPVLFSIGHFALRWYGLAIAAAILVGLAIASREAHRKGLREDDIFSLAMWALAGAFVGARLLHVIDNWAFYAANPGAILALQNGGLAILGGILGGVVVGTAYALHKRLPVGQALDVAAPALILGQAIGRIGCIVNGDAVGARTDLPWGFVYINPGAMSPSLGVAYQPAQVYEMLWDLAVFAFIWWARKRVRVDGQLFLAYLTLYSVGKFAVTAARQEAIVAFGLQQAQVVSLLAIAVCVPLMFLLAARAPHPERALQR
ncbi:MAG: prolipoprotein diacylglyceryl transferase [Chloroflexota bacterium]